MSRADDARRIRDAITVLDRARWDLDEWENAVGSTSLARSCPWGLYLAARKARLCQADGRLTRLGQLMATPDKRETLRWETR